MTPNELATFLRADWPHIQKRAPLLTLDVHEARKVCDALAAAVGLLEKAVSTLSQDHNGRTEDCTGCEVLATLRLVVGEKETA